MRIQNYLRLLTAIALCESAGVLGSFFTVSSISTWYNTLNKPEFSPPNFVFGPVWIILYALMGVSLYLIWCSFKNKSKSKSKNKKEIQYSLILFLIHLGVNAAWSIIFFGLKNPFLAFLNIIILWLLIVAVVYKFYKIDKRASYLLIPYLFWVSFAMVLNYYIWVLNM